MNDIMPPTGRDACRNAADREGSDGQGSAPGRAYYKLFGRRVAMPRSRLVRILLGCLVILLGVLGFLPILGFWMIPLGLLMLSYDIGAVRRWRRRAVVWWGNRNGRKR